MDSGPCLVVGLGNPGSRYASTRHNLGRQVVEAVAAKEGASFKKESRLLSLAASFLAGGRKVRVLLPETYMNLSGRAVKLALDAWQIPVEGLIVVADDVELPFGAMRLRGEGGTGGHNGLASIRDTLGGGAYARLRMGVGRPADPIPLEEYVLTPFSEEERRDIASFVERGAEVVISWCEEGLKKAQELASSWGEESKEKNKKKET